MPVPKTKNIKV